LIEEATQHNISLTMTQPISEYNLAKGESYESTTAYGLHFLEMIRRTKDKR
jgi:hypothetical protein